VSESTLNTVGYLCRHHTQNVLAAVTFSPRTQGFLFVVVAIRWFWPHQDCPIRALLLQFADFLKVFEVTTTALDSDNRSHRFYSLKGRIAACSSSIAAIVAFLMFRQLRETRRRISFFSKNICARTCGKGIITIFAPNCWSSVVHFVRSLVFCPSTHKNVTLAQK
jgi:hypothetical protein